MRRFARALPALRRKGTPSQRALLMNSATAAKVGHRLQGQGAGHSAAWSVSIQICGVGPRHVRLLPRANHTHLLMNDCQMMGGVLLGIFNGSLSRTALTCQEALCRHPGSLGSCGLCLAALCTARPPRRPRVSCFMQCSTFTFSFRMCSASRLTCMQCIAQSTLRCCSQTCQSRQTNSCLQGYNRTSQTYSRQYHHVLEKLLRCPIKDILPGCLLPMSHSHCETRCQALGKARERDAHRCLHGKQ